MAPVLDSACVAEFLSRLLLPLSSWRRSNKAVGTNEDGRESSVSVFAVIASPGTYTLAVATETTCWINKATATRLNIHVQLLMTLLHLPPLVHRLVLFVLYLQFLSHIVHLNTVQQCLKNALVRIKGNNGETLETITITNVFCRGNCGLCNEKPQTRFIA